MTFNADHEIILETRVALQKNLTRNSYFSELCNICVIHPHRFLRNIPTPSGIGEI